MALCASPLQWWPRQEDQLTLWSALADSVEARTVPPPLAELQRRSALLTIYAGFEVELEALGLALRAARHLDLDVGDLRSRGLERSALYLEKVAGLPTAREGPAWLELIRLREIRNLLIHADGRIPEHKPDLLRYLALSPYFKGEDEEGRGHIRLQEGSLRHVLEVWRTYAESLARDMGAAG